MTRPGPRRCAGFVALFVAVVSTLLAGHGQAASSGTTVGASVPSSTSLDVAACAPNTAATAFGPVIVGSSNVTGAPCTVVFGSSNDTSTLRLAQRDGTGAAMISASGIKSTSRPSVVNPLDDVEVVTSTLGWGAGPDGLAVTSDAGASWTYPAFGVGSPMDAVAAWSTTGGVAVGPAGTARRTTDGTTWNLIATGVTAALNDVDATASNAIWAVGAGGTILHSGDGGATWDDQTDPLVTTQALSSVSVVDDQVAWASGDDNTVLRTIDGGATWTVRHVLPSTNTLRIVATSDQAAAAIGRSGCGSCPVRRVTTDGGATWTNYTTGPEYEYLARDPGGTYHVAGPGGTIGRSSDGLATVVPADSTTVADFSDIAAFSSSVVAAVASRGVQLQSVDGGATWNDRNPAADRQLFDIDRAGLAVWAVGDAGAVVRSTDAGATWLPRIHPTSDDLNAVWVRDSTLVLAVGAGGRIVRSTDGGATFTTPASGVGTVLRSVTGSGTSAWAVGDGGVLLRSTDAGATWSPLASGTSNDLHDVSASSSTEAWIAGALGTVRRTTDAGATWSAVVGHGFAGTVSHVVATSSDWQWLASGTSVSRTTDDGATWSASTPHASYGAQGFDAITANEAIVGSTSNRMFATYDGGATWTANQQGGNVTHTGIAIGSSGQALTSTTSASVNEITPTRTIADHAPGAGRGWGDDASSFGACLEQAADGATTDASTWVPTAGCAPANGPAWRAVPSTTGDASSLVARAPTGDANARADLRFGMRVSSSQTSGDYVAPLIFEVIAPG